MQRQAVTKACAVVAGLVVGGGLAMAGPASAPPVPTATLQERPPAAVYVEKAPPRAKAASPEHAPTGIARLQALEAKLQAKETAVAQPDQGLGVGVEYAGATPEERAVLQRGYPAWTKGLALPALHVDYNPAIEQQVAALTGDPKTRKRVEAALRASGRYSHVVLQILREHALPEDLISVVFASSGFQPTAVSARGDAGLWQLSPTEAVLYGLLVKPNYDERRDVELATRAVAKRLAELHDKYGSWELALAAHHAGDATIARLPDVGEKSFWELFSGSGELPRATAEFVPLVLATAIVLKNQREFRFDTAQDSALYPARIQVPAGTDLSLVARAAGTSVDQLRLLNPAILSEFVPSITRDLTIQVPAGTAGRARMLMAQVMSGYGADAMHRRVPSNFDWGRDELPQPAAEFPTPGVGRGQSRDPWLLPALIPPPAAKVPAPPTPEAAAPEPAPAPAAGAAPPRKSGKTNSERSKTNSDWARLAPEPGGRPAQ